MIVLNPGSLHSHLDMADYSGPGSLVSSISNNPAILV